MAHYEIMVRLCEYTGQLVLVRVKLESEHDALCLHNDNPCDDKSAVINWLKANGLKTLK